MKAFEIVPKDYKGKKENLLDVKAERIVCCEDRNGVAEFVEDCIAIAANLEFLVMDRGFNVTTSGRVQH